MGPSSTPKRNYRFLLSEASPVKWVICLSFSFSSVSQMIAWVLVLCLLHWCDWNPGDKNANLCQLLSIILKGSHVFACTDVEPGGKKWLGNWSVNHDLISILAPRRFLFYFFSDWTKEFLPSSVSGHGLGEFRHRRQSPFAGTITGSDFGQGSPFGLSFTPPNSPTSSVFYLHIFPAPKCHVNLHLNITGGSVDHKKE